MRVVPRFALVVVVLALAAAPLAFGQTQATCPLSLVATNPPASDFALSPHGVFHSGTGPGSQVFVLRGQTLTTFTVTDLGDMQVAREDFISSLGARTTIGATTFNNGFLYVTSEAGLEIFDLRGVSATGTAPLLVSRTPGLNYHRIAVNGNTLFGLIPSTDIPCQPNSQTCPAQIDVWNISNQSNPVRVGVISTAFGSPQSSFIGFNDIAINSGFLIATGPGGTAAFNIGNPANPVVLASTAQPGTFLVSNGTSLVGVGNANAVLVYTFTPSDLGFAFSPVRNFTIDPSLAIDRANPIAFHPQAAFNDAGNRLITLVDELDPATLLPARTIAFDVFDNVPQFEGSDPRNYDVVTRVQGDEVLFNPVAVGPMIFTVGQQSGLETWGSCGEMAGRIELDSTSQLLCGGTEIHGWVTGAQKVVNVELFLDNGSLGTASVAGLPRNDVPSATPVFTWRLGVNLDATSRGEHTLRAVGTDALGNRRQFASMPLFFNGPGQNCSVRTRRQSVGKN